MAKTLAKHVLRTQEGFNTKYQRWNMNDFAEGIGVTRLLGSPPGYCGSSVQGALPCHCQQNPDGVLLFDEIEKAHPKILLALLPLLDEGMIQDNFGQTITMDKDKAILVLTSNAAAEQIQEMHQAGMPPEEIKAKILPQLKKQFEYPEFLARIDYIVPFEPLREKAKTQVLERLVDECLTVLRQRPGVDVRVEQGAKDFLMNKAGTLGVRDLQGVVDQYLIPAMVDAEDDDELRAPCIVSVRQGLDGLIVHIEHAAGPLPRAAQEVPPTGSGSQSTLSAVVEKVGRFLIDMSKIS
jgi:ATP-dependent Clp protease ATP-binding subunit ClpA